VHAVGGGVDTRAMAALSSGHLAAVCPEGPAGAHQVINRSEEPCRLLILSSKSPLAIVHYPDSDKVGLWSQESGYQSLLRREPELDYWDGET
jgi:uncharacterized cupin superfamily protein